MATLLAATSEYLGYYIILGAVGACIILWIILYIALPPVREKTHEVWSNITSSGSKSAAGREIVVIAGTEAQQDRILAAIGTELSRVGYVPQSSQPWLYTYVKNQKPSPGVAVLLFLICIIPGIIYLVTANKTLIMTIRFVDQGAGRFRVVAEGPGPGKAAVRRAAVPYST